MIIYYNRDRPKVNLVNPAQEERRSIMEQQTQMQITEIREALNVTPHTSGDVRESFRLSHIFFVNFSHLEQFIKSKEANMTKQRKQAEELVYKVMDALDPTKSMSKYYANLFKDMNDKQFLDYISKKYPYRFQTRIFKIEPTFIEIEKAANILGVPLMEKVATPDLYVNKDGEPVWTKEALVVYLHLKKMKQFLTKKNSISTNIVSRDNKTGRLVGHDKNGATSDREMESLVVSGMEDTLTEFSRARADSVEAKQAMYNTISTLGTVSLEDIPVDKTDVLSKNMMNVYMIGSHINTNLININNMTPQTIKDKTVSRRQ